MRAMPECQGGFVRELPPEPKPQEGTPPSRTPDARIAASAGGRGGGERRKTIRIRIPVKRPPTEVASPVPVRILPKPEPEENNLVFPLGQQALVLLLAAIMLDGAQVFHVVAYAILAYWGCFAILAVRHKALLTFTDRFLIRWGFFLLCAASFLFSQ